MWNSTITKEKIEFATTVLQSADVDVWLTFVWEGRINPDPILEYIAPPVGTLSAFIITRWGEHTAIIGRSDLHAVQQLGVYRILTYDESIRELLYATLHAHQPRQIAINYSQDDVTADGLTHGLYQTLREILQEDGLRERLVSAEAIISTIRGCKSPTEQTLLQRAGKTATRLCDEVEQFVMVGMNQAEIAAFVHERLDRMGLGYAWDKERNPLVTCGPHSPLGYVAPAQVVLEHGHLLQIHFGLKQEGYCAELRRVWYVLGRHEKEAPREIRHAFEAVRGALEAGRAALQCGAQGWEVDESARMSLIAQGYPDYKLPLGHLIGRSTPDGATLLASRSYKMAHRPILNQQTFVLQLHTFVPEHGLLALGENLITTPNGAHYLCPPQTELHYLR